jgi:SAM-dependent methyltransferase
MAFAGESAPGSRPPIEQQQQFWDSWNGAWRFRDGYDPFMEAQRQVALRVAARLPKGARALDVGCGTGWLGNSIKDSAEIWGTDLSPSAIEDGKKRHPDVHLLCGDFLSLDLPGPFQLVISADSLAHMYDQEACVRRIAELLAPGGTFLLMTQNPFVWRRRSRLQPLVQGQLQLWPSLGRIRTLLAPWFEIERVTSIDPGGDRGLLWWVENRWVRGAVGRLIGRQRWRSLLESLRLGRELVVVARRR